MLNQEQKKAVIYNKGPLLIIAGAGTGKTTVIVEKIKHIIKKKLARPEQILALTFTEKAASEMVDRVDREMPYGYFQMWISTFHAFADQVLKEEATNIGISPGFRLMTDAEAIIFLRKNLFVFNLNYFRPLGNPNKFIENLIQHFSRLKDENISPDQYIKWARGQKSKDQEQKTDNEKYIELAYAYKTYQDLKIKEGLFDFSDLIFYLIKLFKTRKNVLSRYQKKFKYVLIDEFQDTNIAQYDLIKMLCPDTLHPKLTVVGDDSQAIYKFRGASVSNIINFMKDYKKARQITLLYNYRSNQEILDTAYRLIKHNDPDTLESQLGISKNLKAVKNKSSKNPIDFFQSGSPEDEAEYVAKEIIKLKDTYQYSDIAVLTRANNHAGPFINAFIRLGIPYQFLGPSALYKQPEVKDLIAYLKVLDNVEDSVSLYRVFNMDIFDIDIEDLVLLMSFSRKTNLSLFEAIKVYLGFFYDDLKDIDFEIYKKYLPLLSKDSKNKVNSIYRMINNHLKRIKKDTAGQILFYFLEDTKYLNKLTNYKTEKEENVALNVSKFFNKLKAFEGQHEDASVSALVDYLDMSMELGESPIVSKTDISSYNAVNIITAHSAKGLEFKVVFLVNLTRGRFPTYEKREVIPIPDKLIKEILPRGDYHLEEERRLFYVGITRAMDKIFMTASKYYGEGKRQQKISPFVIESLGEKNISFLISKEEENKKQLSIFDFKKQKEKIAKAKYYPKNFSYTQLETYERCPLQYKYQYILKVPTVPSASLSFGNTIHKTLQDFYVEYIKDKSVKEGRLMKIYKENWIPLGYASGDHENRMKREGEKILKYFYKTYHNNGLKIIGLEKLFKIKITSDIYINGKIDRIDQSDNKKIEIIDYKTGKKPDEKELKKSLQLSIYAMASTDKGLYNKKLSQVNLTFYYLQAPAKISFIKTDDDIAATKDKIIDIVGQIRTNDFSPKVGPWCDFCPFRMICEAWQ